MSTSDIRQRLTHLVNLNRALVTHHATLRDIALYTTFSMFLLIYHPSQYVVVVLFVPLFWFVKIFRELTCLQVQSEVAYTSLTELALSVDREEIEEWEK